MPYQLITSQFSFIQFGQTDNVSACNWDAHQLCLPVFAVDDLAFQFVIAADTQDEADLLCSQVSQVINIGTVSQCSDEITPFVDNITRYRIGPLQVLYHWPHGITTLMDYAVNECFRVGVEVFDQFFCSNCFIRIHDDCHTSVLEYYGADNAFGFNYCAGETISEDATDCDPLILQFTNQSSMTIPWTTYLQNLYGNTPSVTIWTYDGSELVQAGQVVKYDTYPPGAILLDFGGVNSGVIKISK
jgi:hypothetical protein